MAATEVQVNGVPTPVPGAYSETDVSGMSQPPPGSVGIVALIGSAGSGRPVSAMTRARDVPRMNRYEDVLDLFREGDLREASALTFRPGNDDDIPGGAQLIYGLRVDQATKSTGALGAAIALESRDWGSHTAQISVAVATGTRAGSKKVTVQFEEKVEVQDNLGGKPVGTLTYRRGTYGYDQAALIVAAGVLRAVGVRSASGALSLITTQLTAGNRARVISTNAGDTTQIVTIYGLDNALTPAPQSETLALNGTTARSGTKTWSAIYGVEIDAAHAGTVEVRDDQAVANPIVFDVPTGTLLEGVVVCQACFVDSDDVTVVADGSSTAPVLAFGLDGAGMPIAEKIVLNDATPVAGVASTWAQVDRIVTGAVASARTVSLTATAVETDPEVQKTLQKVADYFNTRKFVSGANTYGFTWTSRTAVLSMPPTKFDAIASTTILNPATKDITSDRWAIIDWLNKSGTLVNASAGATEAPPANTVQPVYLRGGSTSAPTSDDWAAAFTLLRKTKLRVNTVVAISGDPAVHDLAKAHRRYQATEGRNECDVFVGVMNADLDDVPTKTEFLDAVTSLNEAGVRAVGQAFSRFDTSLETREFLPPFLACIAAGMQAGSPVGTSLTFKYADVDDVRQHSSWDPSEDAKEMIHGGAMILEPVEGIGYRWTRNITTYLKEANLARIEGSVVEILDHSAYRLRKRIERLTAKRGLTKAQVLAEVTAELSAQVADGLLVSYDVEGVRVDFKGDQSIVSAPVAPEIPKNFHLIRIQARPAA